MENLRKSFMEIEAEFSDNTYVRRVFMVEMSDHIKLETIVFFPKSFDENACWSVLLTRTPYKEMGTYQETIGQEFANRGIVFIYQFCRGIGNSEGDWIPNVNERQDGIDTVTWVHRQPWCQTIGLHGSSYMALTAWVCADQLPSKVVGIFVSHYGVDRYASAYESGLFRHDILTGWALGNSGVPIDNFEKKYMEAVNFRPHINADIEVFGKELPWYREWISETDYESAYWQEGFWHTLKTMPSKVTVPVCILAGWFDHHLKGTLLAYEWLNKAVKGKSSLIVGGWNHSFELTVGAHTYDNGAINMQKELYDWFKPLFKKEEPVNRSKYYMIGEDKWVYSDLTEMKDASFIEFFPVDELESKVKSMSLKDNGAESIIEYIYDPKNPVKSIGGETLFVSEAIRGCQRQPKAGYRDDVISFVSEALDEEVSIVGKIKVVIEVSSSCEDSCFSVKVMDVFENGDTYNMRNGLTTLAYRNGALSRGQYKANTRVTVEIDMLPIAWTLKKGHALRVDLSSSNFPEYAVHSNQVGVWSQIDSVIKANQKIYVGKNSMSKIIVPINIKEISK